MARVNDTRHGFFSVEVCFKISCFYTDVVRAPSRGHLKHMLLASRSTGFLKKMLFLFTEAV